MQELVDARDLEDILKAFENRIRKGKKRSPIKPSFYNKIIEKLDEEMCD